MSIRIKLFEKQTKMGAGAKAQTDNDLPTSYWKWFRKNGTKLRSGHFRERPTGSVGPPMTKRAMSTRQQR
jgi:hypothetical protein